MRAPLTIGYITREQLRVMGFPVPDAIDCSEEEDEDGPREPLFPMDHIPHTNS